MKHILACFNIWTLSYQRQKNPYSCFDIRTLSIQILDPESVYGGATVLCRFFNLNACFEIWMIYVIKHILLQFCWHYSDIFVFFFIFIQRQKSSVCFTPDHQTFCSLFKVRQHVIGCINYDIVVGLCSELLMRISYYIHLA